VRIIYLRRDITSLEAELPLYSIVDLGNWYLLRDMKLDYSGLMGLPIFGARFRSLCIGVSVGGAIEGETMRWASPKEGVLGVWFVYDGCGLELCWLSKYTFGNGPCFHEGMLDGRP
jgi:hypothetical protein